MTEQQGNPSIYDIDFAILDEKKYSEVVKPRPEVQLPTGHSVEVGEFEDSPTRPGPIGQVALSSALEHEIVVDLTTVEPTNNASSVDRYRNIPPEIIEVTSRTIDTLLETTEERLVHIAEISKIAFGENRAEKQDFRLFLDCLNLDPRIEYLGSGQYAINSRDDRKPYWPGEVPNVDQDKIAELTVAITKKLLKSESARLFIPQILGIAKSSRGLLSVAEINELFASIASAPGVIANEDGSFSINLTEEELALRKEEKRILPADFAEKNGAVDESRTMTEAQVSRILKTTRRSPEFREALDLAKRRANPRKRGKNNKKNKLQGKTHNKAKKVEQSIALMMTTNPPQAAAKNATPGELKNDAMTTPVIGSQWNSHQISPRRHG